MFVAPILMLILAYRFEIKIRPLTN
jgi:hypothetical protein